jgi:16S rRNA (cytosine1402-N4)-methyltransferase
MTEFEHDPVMRDAIVDTFRSVPSGVVLDATLGGGGHAEAILDARADLRLLGLDRDADALAAATSRLDRFGDRVMTHHCRFDELDAAMSAHSVAELSGALFDLGVSSPQLDRAERGFSFRGGGPLDMRMGQDGPTAAELLNRMTEAELTRLFHEYGEEPEARRVARAVVASRARAPISTTVELADLVRRTKRAGRGQGSRIDPATLVFQALRIAVNDELGQLEEALPAAIRLLRPHGRVAVISFHSLEDRIVKRYFRAEARGCVCPPDFPVCACGKDPALRVLTTRAVRPDAREVALNPRAASARLRVAEKV